jgi:hypothetical protein
MLFLYEISSSLLMRKRGISTDVALKKGASDGLWLVFFIWLWIKEIIIRLLQFFVRWLIIRKTITRIIRIRAIGALFRGIISFRFGLVYISRVRLVDGGLIFCKNGYFLGRIFVVVKKTLFLSLMFIFWGLIFWRRVLCFFIVVEIFVQIGRALGI